jgi:hypothetical protein
MIAFMTLNHMLSALMLPMPIAAAVNRKLGGQANLSWSIRPVLSVDPAPCRFQAACDRNGTDPARDQDGGKGPAPCSIK